MPPAVAHAMSRYLGLSETFIYATLNNFRRYHPVVVCETTDHLDLFPFEAIYATSGIRRFSWWWFVNGLHYRLSDKATFSEHLLYVRHVLKSQRIQIVHAHFGPTGVRLLPVRRALGIPLVTTFYGYDMSELPREKRWREAYARLFAEGDLFLVEGGHMRDALITLGCPADKVEVQRIGVALELLPFKERVAEPDEKVITLFCGRFTEKKGLLYALQALALVIREFPAIELRIIGDGEERPAIERTIAGLRLEPFVTLMGYQPHQVFREQLGQAHLFIQPSVTAANGDTEGGAPTVILEAQACGLPILATRHADIPEIVAEPESGLLVPERDVNALAQNWLELLRHPERWPKMGRAGRALVERQHSVEKLVSDLERRYDRLIAARGKT